MITTAQTYATWLFIAWLVSWGLRTPKQRQFGFLIASYFFYAQWETWFLVVLVFSSLINYGLGHYLRRRPTVGRLWVGIVLNLILLSTFKYLPLIGALAKPGSSLAPLSHILLPIGISFWTFQALSYLLDLYREEDINPSLMEFCLYMAFWPTVFSGPICRLPSLLPQFRQVKPYSWDEIGTGMHRICIGILMTITAQVLAGGLGPNQGVNAGFDLAGTRVWGGADVWCLAIGYGFQLFFDFCGYSHIVIGVARLFGIQLHENFDRPFLSTTPSMFWTRWHMSLSFWVRDYIFLPLAMVRREAWWRNVSLVLAMLIFGLWHNANLLFFLYGLYHGLLLVLHRQYQQWTLQLRWQWPRYLQAFLSWGVTFAAVSMGWIFFRAGSVDQAFSMFEAIISPGSYHHLLLPRSLYLVVALVMVTYFALQGIGGFLDRKLSASESTVDGVAPATVIGLLARERWVWIAPIVAVGLIYLSVILQAGPPTAPPFVYGAF